jgi:hypothetical protein
LAESRDDRKAWELSGAKDAVGRTAVIADGGYRLLAAPTGAEDGLRLPLPLPLPRRSPIGRDLGARRPRRRTVAVS